MTINPIELGMLKAAEREFNVACDEVDRRTQATMDEGLRAAGAALLRGDLAERDRICDRLQRLPKAATEAKREIGLRIGERLGMDRDELMAAVAKLRGTRS
jgi:hypothetical protein